VDNRVRNERSANCADLDEVFLRWLEARVASSGPDASEDALNYLVATALLGPGSHDGD
jgi:hypothetical protein